MIDTNRLKAEVLLEASKLKELAETEELGKLNFGNLDPHHVNRCIYGQMTGHCRSERASELLRKCATPYSRNLYDKWMPYEEERYAHLSVIPELRRDADLFSEEDGYYFSPIELYLTLPHAKQKNLIDYLQGRSEDVEL